MKTGLQIISEIENLAPYVKLDRASIVGHENIRVNKNNRLKGL